MAEETNGRTVVDGEEAEQDEEDGITVVAEDKVEAISANRVPLVIWIKLKSLERALMALCV